MPAPIFKNQELLALYQGFGQTNTDLNRFRDLGSDEVRADIDSLDQRIAAFETVLFGALPSGKTSQEFPYDKVGLRREFLDEVLALLIRRSVTSDESANSDTLTHTFTDSTLLRLAKDEIKLTAGNVQIDHPDAVGTNPAALRKNGTTGYGNFSNLETDVPIDDDPRLNLLNDTGKRVFRAYAALIDGVFAEGEAIGTEPGPSAQIVSAIRPITIDGVVYDRMAQVAGSTTTIDNQQIPTYNTFLLEAGTETARVVKSATGEAVLTGADPSTKQRLLLSPSAATPDLATQEYTVLLDGLTFRVSTVEGEVLVRTDPASPAQPAEAIPPLLLNTPGRGHEFPDTNIAATHRYQASNGSSYLIGVRDDGVVYVTSLAPARREAVNTTVSLPPLEYLLFYNEERTRILRAQLSYREAVVREIQDDLKRANQALADLEVQAGYVTATDSEGQPTWDMSAETIGMSMFNATSSRAGDPIFRVGGNDAWHGATEWAANRTNLKNYIDRRSAEAQEATLDYQNVLNRFNSALEVMAKLQEKLDTLLKTQLRNIA